MLIRRPPVGGLALLGTRTGPLSRTYDRRSADVDPDADVRRPLP